MTADQFKRAAQLLRGQVQTYPQISEDESGGYVSQDDEEMAQMADELDLAAERISEKEAAEQKRRADLYDELVEFAQEFLDEYQSDDGMGALKYYAGKAHTILAKCKGEKA